MGDLTALSVCLLLGLVLGQRFNVFVLFPAIAAAVTFALGCGIARGDTVWSIALLAVSLPSTLQAGYFVGTLLRSSLADAWAPPQEAASSESGETRAWEHPDRKARTAS